MKGYKTYLVALAMVAYGGLGWLLGYMDGQAALKLIMEGLGLSALRAGVAKSGPNA